MRGTVIYNWAIVRSPKLVQARNNEVRATINFLILYQGNSPFTYCAISAGHCATSAGQCTTSAGHLHYQCWSTGPPVLFSNSCHDLLMLLSSCEHKCMNFLSCLLFNKTKIIRYCTIPIQ
jgi:hypothetical protein